MVAVAVLAGAALWWRHDGSSSPARDRDSRTSALMREKPAGTLASIDGGAASAEIARLQERVARLEAEVKEIAVRGGVKAKPTAQEVEQFVKALKEYADLEAKGLDGAGEENESYERQLGTRHGPEAVTGILGFDPDRKKAFLEAYQRTASRIRTIEAAKAIVTVDGSTTRIRIPAFASEGGAVIAEWRGALAGLLTAEQKESYERLKLGLFPANLGEGDRLVVIHRAGNTVALTDYETLPEGKEGRHVSFNGPADLGVRPYRHLLKDD